MKAVYFKTTASAGKRSWVKMTQTEILVLHEATSSFCKLTELHTHTGRNLPLNFA